MSLERFVESVSTAIVSLPQDLKAVLRVVDEPDLDDASRVSAAGALMHVLSSFNAIPGTRGIVAYVDDVLVLRLALERIAKQNPEVVASHKEQAPELWDGELLETARGYLGDIMKLIESAVDGLPKLSHQGHAPGECVKDVDGSNWLYDAVHAAIVEKFEFDEEAVVREVRGVEKVLAPLRSKHK